MSLSAPKEGYPLAWPLGVTRTLSRTSSHFKANGIAPNYRFLANELKLFRAIKPIISCDLHRKGDGSPYQDATEPRDPGVAVYFDRWQGRDPRAHVITCDAFGRIWENLRALASTIEALRAIERYGSSKLLEQALSGFAALPPGPAAPPKPPWWEVLGVPSTATRAEIQSAYFDLARKHHPDFAGGSTERMAEINAARDEGVAARG